MEFVGIGASCIVLKCLCHATQPPFPSEGSDDAAQRRDSCPAIADHSAGGCRRGCMRSRVPYDYVGYYFQAV